MWSSVSVDKNGIVSGGVSTAEKVWIICKEHQSEMFDVSSYEYSISLLCQAFRTDEGKCRISEMQRAFNVTDDLAGASQSVTESLSIAYLALARAHAILNQEEEVISACKRCLDCVKASRRSLKSGTDASTSLHGKRKAFNRYYREIRFVHFGCLLVHIQESARGKSRKLMVATIAGQSRTPSFVNTA